MKKDRITGLIGCIVFVFAIGNADGQNTQKADRWFDRSAYHNALSEYRRLLAEESGQSKQTYIEYRAGLCCMEMNRYDHALEWLEKAEREGYDGNGLKCSLGEAYLMTGNYEKAKTYFEQCLAQQGENEMLHIKIASCDFGMQAPLTNSAISIEPLPYLNTRGSEYGVSFLPFGMLYSSTGDLMPEKNGEVSQRTGMGYSRPYVSMLEDGEYQPGRLLKGIWKSDANDGSFTFDEVNKILYCTRCEVDRMGCRIITARLKNGKYKQTGFLKIGKEDYNIAHPFITNNGNRIYFSSTLKGGYGGADIWYTDRDFKGNWGEPQNAGAAVNTPGHEVFPYIWNDNFFFASNGHVGYGGFDIYKASVTGNEFGKAENMGPGFNTSYDDLNLVMNEDGLSGLLVTNRLPDRSDDIYRFQIKTRRDIVNRTIERDIIKKIEKEVEVPSEIINITADTIVLDEDGPLKRQYRMGVKVGDVTLTGWWIQVAMLMRSRLMNYDEAITITRLTGRRIIMYKGNDGGHRFYIGEYPDEQQAREVVALLKKAGIDCFIKDVKE